MVIDIFLCFVHLYIRLETNDGKLKEWISLNTDDAAVMDVIAENYR